MATDSLIALVGFFLVNMLAASSGAFFRPGPWYTDLRKPSWTPPNLAFPIVWSLLYALNAVAGWMVSSAGAGEVGPELSAYGVSLLINAAWSGVFFGTRNILAGLAVVIMLWLSILAVMILFAPVNLMAALILIPYLGWVTIAAALNLRIAQMNVSPADRN